MPRQAALFAKPLPKRSEQAVHGSTKAIPVVLRLAGGEGRSDLASHGPATGDFVAIDTGGLIDLTPGAHGST